MAKTRWSSLKKSVEARLCEPLQKRVQIHKTLYRGSHNGCQFDTGAGRFWVLLDHEQIFSASDLELWNAVVPVREERRRATGSVFSGDAGWYAAQEQAIALVHAQGLYSHYDCHGALKASLNLSIEAALTSSHPLIKTLALVDKRLGARRLKTLELTDTEHELVQRFYTLRCSIERL